VYLIQRPTLLRTLITGAILGAFIAITRLGPRPFSFQGIVAVLAAGAVVGLVVAIVRRSIQSPSKGFSYLLLALAGGSGGLVWWLFIHPASSLLLAAVLGALLTQAVVAFESWLRQAAA
jgi:hypothetical protein